MGEWMVQRLKRAYSCKANVFEPYESCFRAMFLGQASSVAHPRGTAKKCPLHNKNGRPVPHFKFFFHCDSFRPFGQNKFIIIEALLGLQDSPAGPQVRAQSGSNPS